MSRPEIDLTEELEVCLELFDPVTAWQAFSEIQHYVEHGYLPFNALVWEQIMLVNDRYIFVARDPKGKHQ